MRTVFNNKFKVVLAAMLLTPSIAFATNGYFAHGWGMKSKAMAGAGIANAEDGLTAANNPAGMASVGNRIDFGLDVFSPDRSASTVGSGGDQNADGNGDDNFLIPEFGYNQMLNDSMSIGVSVYGNGGMNTNYENGILLFNGGAGPTGVDLSQLFIAPTFAIKVDKQHSFGVSINLAYQQFEAQGIGGFAGFSSSAANLSDNGMDSSTGYGFSLGYLGQLTPDFALGVSYRSETAMSKFDKYSGLFAEQGDFDIPAMYGLGIKYTPSSTVTILFDYTHISYSDIAAIANDSSTLFTSQLGNDDGAGFGWQDMDIYKLGVAWQVSKGLTLMAGWNHGEQPIPTSETLFNILAPATIEDHLTLGATWVMGKDSELTVAYMHAFENTVNGSGSIAGGLGGGEANIGMSQDSLGIAYGWAF